MVIGPDVRTPNSAWGSTKCIEMAAIGKMHPTLSYLGHYWGPIKIARVHVGTFMRDSFEIGLFSRCSSLTLSRWKFHLTPIAWDPYRSYHMAHMFFGLQWSQETISSEIMGGDGVDRRLPWNDLNLTKEIGLSSSKILSDAPSTKATSVSLFETTYVV